MNAQTQQQDDAPQIVQGETLEDIATEVGQVEQAATPPPPQPDPQTVALLAGAIGTALSTFAPNWLAISEAQRAELARHGIDTPPAALKLAVGFAPLLDYYFPNLKPSGPWATALVSVAEALGPCIGQPLRLPPPPIPATPPPGTDENPDTGG